MKIIKIEISGDYYDAFKTAVENAEEFTFSLISELETVKIKAECIPLSRVSFSESVIVNSKSTSIKLVEIKKV